MQQRGAGLQRVAVLAVEDLRPVEAERAVVGPFVAVEQQPLVKARQQHVARRRVGAEHDVGEQVRPRLVAQVLGDALGPVEEGRQGEVEQRLLLQRPAGRQG